MNKRYAIKAACYFAALIVGVVGMLADDTAVMLMSVAMGGVFAAVDLAEGP